MNARQARALLELIADLYTVAQVPDPPPASSEDQADTPADEDAVT